MHSGAVSVKSYLTFEASVCPENAGTYSAGNGGQTICGGSLKPLRCRDQALQDIRFSCGKRTCALFTSAKFWGGFDFLTRKLSFCCVILVTYLLLVHAELSPPAFGSSYGTGRYLTCKHFTLLHCQS